MAWPDIAGGAEPKYSAPQAPPGDWLGAKELSRVDAAASSVLVEFTAAVVKVEVVRPGVGKIGSS